MQQLGRSFHPRTKRELSPDKLHVFWKHRRCRIRIITQFRLTHRAMWPYQILRRWETWVFLIEWVKSTPIFSCSGLDVLVKTVWVQASCVHDRISGGSCLTGELDQVIAGCIGMVDRTVPSPAK